MVLISYFSIIGMVRRHLAENIDDLTATAEANINIGLSETEVALTSLAYTVRDMIGRGESHDAILSFMLDTTNWMRKRGDASLGFNGVYGFIQGKFVDGIGLNPGENYVPQRHNWYDASIRGDSDAVSFTEPYADARTGHTIITAVRNVTSSSGEHYGIIALDIDLSWFRKYVRSFRRFDGAYCMITNQYMVVVGHPNDEDLGRPLYETGEGYRTVYNLLLANRPVLSMRITDGNGTQVITSFRQMFNGWYVGVIVPLRSYYRDVYFTAAALSIIGTMMTLLLSVMLLRLSAARIRSDEANISKSAFLATMSHEIRTPLNAILGFSEIQLRKNLPCDTHSDLEKIYSSGSNLLRIINDILDISKIEAGGFEIVSADFDVAALINDIVQLNIVRIGSKNIAFELEIDETMPSRLRGDDLRIRQILNNLLSNAFKYTREGKVSFCAIWRPEGAHAALTFTVSDTGMGIKKSDMSKLFTKYSQLDFNANRNIEGTGLGLAITKRLVELMRGTIEAESEYGKGSVFRVELALEIALGTPIEKKTVEGLKHLRFMENLLSRGKNLVPSYMPYGRVLIVDDVTTNLDVAKGQMIPYGLSIDCASSGREAIEKIRSIGDGAPASEKYDIVFMDHMMPEMDGIETTRIIRGEIGTEYARTAPIIALTANAISGNEDMFLAAGVDGFIPKPIDIMELDAALNKWVRDKKSDGTRSETAMKTRMVFSMDGKLQTDLAGRRLEGIDSAEGTRRYGGESAYLQILRSYAANTPKLLRRIQNPSQEDMRDYAVAVHGLKGASLGICANALAEKAEYLENAAKAGDFGDVMEANGNFIHTAESLLADLDKLLKSVEKSRCETHTAKERALSPDSALLEKMRAASMRSMTSEMESILTELERYEYESGGELVEWMRERIDNLEYRAITERLEGEI
jgi:signal transduction histidine kinase/DNA-binding response OmpR family regulator/HPt (histidine-containing phosphotransfer) domain-containing protein